MGLFSDIMNDIPHDDLNCSCLNCSCKVDPSSKDLDLTNNGTFNIWGPINFDFFIPFSTKFEYLNPIKVFGGDGELLGFATAYVNKFNLTARCFIKKDCEERFEIKENNIKYFLAIQDCQTFTDSDFKSRIKILSLKLIDLRSLILKDLPETQLWQPIQEQEIL